MKSLRAGGMVYSILAVTMLLVLSTWFWPTPADAITCTYTGKPFDPERGSGYPIPPPLGDHITVRFTYDGDLASVRGQQLAGNAGLTDFAMTCGDVVIEYTQAWTAELVIDALDSHGRPDRWWITLGNGPPGGARVELLTASGYDSAYKALNGNVDFWFGSNGEWNAVPLPPSVYLLGAGLICLAVARRKKRLTHNRTPRHASHGTGDTAA